MVEGFIVGVEFDSFLNERHSFNLPVVFVEQPGDVHVSMRIVLVERSNLPISLGSFIGLTIGLIGVT